MRNIWDAPSNQPEQKPTLPGKGVNAEQPMPFHVAAYVSAPNAPRHNRALRRRGAAYAFAPAAKPARHGICRHCDRRTFLGKESGLCRKDFLAGEGEAVAW